MDNSKQIPSLSEQAERGELLASVLNLRKIPKGQPNEGDYATQWGSKTAIGLFRTVDRIITYGG